MSRIFFIACYSLFVCGMVSAQTLPGALLLQVTDSASRAGLPGARIVIVSGRDTANVVTDGSGAANYRRAFHVDSLDLSAYHIGYQAAHLRIKSPRNGEMVHVAIPLVEELREIAEIVVVGEALAVVVKGDTVQFNASAFKTFANDPMSRLFDILPGMKLVNGHLMYLGERIHRITIDGQRLFGDHVDLALKHIRADDVVDVRVYREASDWSKLNEVANPPRHMVADVRTRSKPSLIQQRELSLAAGAAADPVFAEEGGGEGLYDGWGNWIFSRVGKTVDTRVGAGTMRSDRGSLFAIPSTRNPYKTYATVYGNLRFSGEVPNKLNYSTLIKTSMDRYSTLQWINWSYFPTDAYSSRAYRNRRTASGQNKHLSGDNTLKFTLRDKSSVSANVLIHYGNEIRDALWARTATVDGVVLQQQRQIQKNQKEPYTVLTGLQYRKKIGATIFDAEFSARINQEAGSGGNIDTVSTSSTQIHVEDTRFSTSRSFRAKPHARFSLTPTVSLGLSEELSYSHRQSRRMSLDLLTDVVDTTKSYDYIIHEWNNVMGASFTYQRNAKTTGITGVYTGVGWNYRDMLRGDWFPDPNRRPLQLNLFSASASLTYKLSAFNGFTLKYQRVSPSVSLLDFIELDDSNPMMVSAGNPELIVPTRNSLSMNGKLISGPGTYEFTMGLTTEENSIVYRIYYYEQDTYLPMYDYTVKAGATLSRQENLNGYLSFHLRGDYSRHSKKLQSNIRFEASYQHTKKPGYVYEQRRDILADAYNASLWLAGNFSSVFMPVLGSVSAYHNRANGLVRNRWFTQSLEGELRVLVSDAVELNSLNTFNWNLQWPEIPGMDRFGWVSNLSIGYLFDARGNLKLNAQGYDLLNRQQRIIARVNEEFIHTQYDHIMGRYFLIRLDYKF